MLCGVLKLVTIFLLSFKYLLIFEEAFQPHGCQHFFAQKHHFPK